MSSWCPIVESTQRSDQLLLLFRDKHTHLAVVQDRVKTIGVVTLEDVLEQLVGEIEDEHDEDGTPLIAERSDGSFDADARVRNAESETDRSQLITKWRTSGPKHLRGE